MMRYLTNRDYLIAVFRAVEAHVFHHDAECARHIERLVEHAATEDANLSILYHVEPLYWLLPLLVSHFWGHAVADDPGAAGPIMNALRELGDDFQSEMTAAGKHDPQAFAWADYRQRIMALRNRWNAESGDRP